MLGEWQGLAQLCAELGNPVRLRLLSAVAGEAATVTALVPGAGLSPQEVSRHLSRLQALGLVERGAGRRFAATPYGRALLETLPEVVALQGHRDFLARHDLAALPKGTPVRPLAAARHEVAPPTANVLVAAETLAGAERDATFLADRLGWAAPALQGLLARGGSVDLLLPWTSGAHDGVLGFLEALPPGASRRVRLGLVAEAPLVLALTEAGFVAFFRASGGLDYGHLVRGEGPALRAWAGDVLARVRAEAVLAHDPARHAPEQWRGNVTAAAARFLAPRRRVMPPA